MKLQPLRILLLSLCLTLAVSPFAYGETPAGDPQSAHPEEQKAASAEPEKVNALLEKATAKTAALGALQEDIDKINSELRTAQDEDYNVLRDQRRRKYAEMRDELKILADNIVALESAGGEARPARQAATALSGQVSDWLKAEIADSLKRLSGLDDQLKTAADADLPELRQQIASERKTVDEELAALLENTDLMERLGVDSQADLKYLDKTLVQRADSLAARLQYLIEQRDGLRKQTKVAGEDDKKLIKEKVASLDTRISSTAENLKITIELMGERNLETAEYKKILITSTGEITKDIFESKVALGLLQQSLDSGREWLIDNGPRWTFKLIVFVIILLVFSALSNIVKRIARRALSSTRLKASVLLQNLLVSFAGKAVFLIGLLIALAQLGIKIGPVLAGLGIVGFIIGFALQETLSNFASGMMILIYQPFDVGDAVEAGGVSGVVRQMNLVSTTITTFDNQKVIVPNRKIWGDVIRNINAEDKRRVDMTFGIGYDDDAELADRILHEIVDQHELALKDPPPVIRLHSLGESSVDFIVRPWVKSADYWATYWHITRTVKQRFDEAGISIPFPQRDLHLYQHEAGSPARG